MDIIKVNFIDNCSHGYLSVGKKDFLKVIDNPTLISKFSGMTFTRIYLEEDQDATIFIKQAEKKGFTLSTKNCYNPNFAIHHNYIPDLINYTPKIGDIINSKYRIIATDKKRLTIELTCNKNYRYSIPVSNPFNYITDVEKF